MSIDEHLSRRLTGLWATLKEQGWWLLIAVMLAGGALWAFAELADEVVDGETADFDRAVMLALREPGNPEEPLGPEWLEMVARDITALGGVAVLSLLTLAAIGFMCLRRRWGSAGFIFIHAMEATSASFPSGHSMLAVITYLTLGAVLAEVQSQHRYKVYILAWAVLISLLVGWSRVFLGVHWPTDVLAGWCVGSAWALLCGTAAYWLQVRGVIEGRPALRAGAERAPRH
jgi:undecaprenyl-diphosphatase